MQAGGRILVNGRDAGGAFAIAPRLALTANHCVRDRDDASLVFAVDGLEVPVTSIDHDEDLDVALLRLAGDVPSTLTPRQAQNGDSWRVESQPHPNDPMLTGGITGTKWKLKNSRGGEMLAIQMQVEQHVDWYAGYSGSAVTSPPGTSSVVGVLVEQALSRRHAAGEPPTASNVLFATAIEDVIERFELEAHGVVATQPSTPTGVAPGRTITDRVSGLRVAAAVEHWRDRETFLAELRGAVLDANEPVISVIGRRGIGKSALVAKVLAEFERPDANREPSEDLSPLVYMSSRRGGLTLAAVYQAVARIWDPAIGEPLALRWQSAGVAGLADFWEELRGRRPVIVLDNLDDLQHPETLALSDPELEDLLDSACCTPHDATIVTTSQHPLTLPADFAGAVRLIEVPDGLARDDAVALIRSSAARGAERLASISDDRLADAAERVDGRPRGLQKLALMLDRRPALIRTLMASDALPEEVLEILVSTTYTAMSAQDQLVMQGLALAAAPLHGKEVADLLDGLLDRNDVDDAVTRLIDTGEISEHGDTEVLELHPLDAEHVRRKLVEGDPERQVLLDTRLADRWAARRTPHDRWRTLDDTLPSKREYVHRWRAGDHATALAVMADAAEWLPRWGEGAVVGEAVAKARKDLDSADALGAFLACVCDARREFFDGSLDTSLAVLHRAREMAQAAGLLEEITDLDLWIGAAHRYRNEPELAIEALQPIADAPPDAPVTRSERQLALFELGLSLLYDGQLDRATEAANRLAALVEPGDPPLAHAFCLNLRALAAIASRDYDGAEAAATAATSHYEQTPYWTNREYMANVKGLALLARGDTEGAVSALDEAVLSAAASHLGRMHGICATNLAWAQLRAARYEAAILAAELAADRLASNGAQSDADTARALADAIRSGRGRPRDEVRAALAHASALALNNPDIHLPSEAFLDAVSDALASAA